MRFDPGDDIQKLPILPTEIVLMIFENIEDLPTLLSIRLTNSFYNNHTRNVRKHKLFSILRINKSRHHSALKVYQMKKLDLLQWVQKVEVCTSSYFGLPTKEDEERIKVEKNVYTGGLPEPYDYDDNIVEHRFLEMMFEHDISYMPDEASKMGKFKCFLTYVLRTLAEYQLSSAAANGMPTAPRSLELHLFRDQSAQDIYDHMALRYPNIPIWSTGHNNRTLQIPEEEEEEEEAENPSEQKQSRPSADTITEFMCLSFSDVLDRIFKADKNFFGKALNLHEIRYRNLPRILMETDGHPGGLLLCTDHWLLGFDYQYGIGKEYQIEVKDLIDDGEDLSVGELICRRFAGKEIGYPNQVVIRHKGRLMSLRELVFGI